MSSRTVQHLREEHDEIRAILDAFDVYLEQGLSQSGADHEGLATLVDCLAESIFLLHEEKEETVLLPELSRHGLSWSDGTLAHVRQDHRHGRYLLRSLRQSGKEKRAWSEEQKRHVLSIGKELIDFNRRHMDLEETQLFPFLDGALSPEEDAALAAQFEGINEEFAGMDDAERLGTIRETFLRTYRP